MKKLYSLLTVLMVVSSMTFAQLSGTKTIPGDYPTIADAIDNLNTYGVGSGGVNFNIAAGHVEQFSNPLSGLITVANSLPSKPITFRKSGEGANPKIYAGTGSGSGDYIFCIAGTDYVTFDGLDILDTASVASTFEQAEYGIAIAKSAVDTSGTQFCTIKNCTISLQRSNTNTKGIAMRHWRANPDGTLQLLGPINNPRKSNSNNSFQGNYITNSFIGMYLYGYASAAPYEYYDYNTDIGSVTGNTITNFGYTSGSCNGLYTQYQSNMTLANNLFTSTVQGGTCYVIEMQLTSASNLNMYGNTITVNYLGTLSFSGIRNYMGNSGSISNTINIHHNIVTGCTAPNAAGSVTYMDLGHAAPLVNIYENQITNNQYGSVTAPSQAQVHYLYIGFYPEKLGTVNIYNNVVSNNTRFQSPTGAGGVTRYMRFGPQAEILNIYGNICENNVSATSGTVYGMEVPSLRPVTKNFYNNTFTNLSAANGTTYCMYFTDGYNWNIHHNKVLNVEGTSTTSQIIGLMLNFTTGSGNIFVYNNMIGNLKTSISGNTAAVTGIVAYCGPLASQVGFYHNTIYLNASSTGTNFGSAGMFISKYLKSVDLRNNLIVNTSTSNGTGKTVAIYTDSVGFGNLAPTSNNNNYYAGTPSSKQLIFTDGVTDNQTLLQYRTRFYPKEYLSVSENAPFVSVTSPIDLHLNNTVATQCESGGVPVMFPIQVSEDFDGQPRYPHTGYPDNPSFPAVSTDIGADEFAGIPQDLTPPFISYVPFPNTAIMGNRTLTTTITDLSGVPVGGTGLPRLLWKLNTTGAWNTVTATSAGNNQYTFPFGAGAGLGDTVYYYVVAQDMAAIPNVGISPLAGAGGYGTNPPSASTPPTVPDKYVIVQPICGTFTVGVGKNYPTLTAAVNDINTKGITCPVTLILTDNNYLSETLPITLQPNGGSSEVNTLTIKPQAGVKPFIAGVSAGNGIFKINGFDYLVIDGSATGGNDKSMIFYNASETDNAYTIGIFNHNGSNPATNVTIKNCVIKGKRSYTVTNYGIFMNSSGGGYDNIVITADSIYGAHTGIHFTGNFNNFNHNGQIVNNVIGSVKESQYIMVRGINLQYADNTLISGNDIMGAAGGNGLPLHRGIDIQAGSTSTKIHKNLIHDFYRNADDGSGAVGIWYESESSTVTEIFNNAIYAIKSSGAAPGVSPNNPYGIYIKSGGNIRIIHNSIWLYGNLLSPTNMYDASSACIGIYLNGSLTNNLDIRNNIFKNSMQGLYGQCPLTGKAFGIMTTASDAANFSYLDYNDYYIDGCNGQVGQMNFSSSPNISAWQGATGMEAHSLNLDPVFSSPSNLVPTTGLMPKKGVFIPEVTTDIVGNYRTNPPDMGVREFTTAPSAIALAATNITVTGATLNGSVSAAGENVYVYFDYGTSTAYGTQVTATPPLATGQSPTAVAAAITGLAPNTTYHFRVRGVTINNLIVYSNDMTFTTPCINPLAASQITGTSSVMQGQNGVAYSVPSITYATGYTWNLPQGATIASGNNTNSILVNFSASAISGVITVAGTNSCGSGALSPDFAVTVTSACQAPVSVVAGSLTGTSVLLSWNAPNPVPSDGYEYEVRTSGLPGSGAIGLVSNGVVTAGYSSVTVSGLTPGTVYYAWLRSNCGDSQYSSWSGAPTFMTVPVNLTVTGTVNAPETRCYNATGTITVAGGGTSFLISSGGSATLIAGQKISFLPGTTVLSGGYMHGYITTNDQYCTNPTYPMVSSPEQKEATPSVEIPETVSASLRVYPNPAREMFTVEITGSTDDLITAIDVYSLNGLKISSFSDVNSRGFTLTSVGMTPGLYFIRVQTTNGVKTLKLIRN